MARLSKPPDLGKQPRKDAQGFSGTSRSVWLVCSLVETVPLQGLNSTTAFSTVIFPRPSLEIFVTNGPDFVTQPTPSTAPKNKKQINLIAQTISGLLKKVKPKRRSKTGANILEQIESDLRILHFSYLQNPISVKSVIFC